MNSNGVISAPVSLSADIYPVLGIGKKGDFYDTGYACSNTHGRINMWSRYKPVRWNNKPAITMQNPQWWKAEDGKCGIGFPTRIASYKDIPAQMTADKKNGWTYSAPDGYPFYYTMDMFENYKHNANPPIYNFSVPSVVSQDGYINASCAFGLAEAPDPDGNKSGPGSIALDDITGETLSGEDAGTLSDYYLGIVIIDSNGVVKGRVAGGQTDHMQTKYSAAGLTLGYRYKAYPFLAKYAMGLLDNDIMNSYITIPNTTYAEFKVGTPEEVEGLHIALNAKYVYLNGTTKSSINYTLTITKDSGSFSFSNNYLQMRFLSNNPVDPLEVGEKRIKLDEPISVTDTTPYTKNGIFAIDPAYADQNYYLYLTLSSGKYTDRILPLEELIPEFTPTVSWSTQSGTWNQSSNSAAMDGKKFTCVSPGSSSSAVIRCTFSGIASITFKCRYQGESSYDYLTVGSIDTQCTRDSYNTSLKGTSGTWKEITYNCNTNLHYVEFCYSKDSSVDESPDNAEVYVLSYS